MVFAKLYPKMIYIGPALMIIIIYFLGGWKMSLVTAIAFVAGMLLRRIGIKLT